MARVVYRSVNGAESIVAVHSVNTEAAAGGVRWYEFRVDEGPQRRSCTSRAPTRRTRFYRWMASPGDRPVRQHRDRLFVRRHAALRRPALRRTAAVRSAGRPDAARDDPGRRRRGADQHRPLGGLLADRRRSAGRLHDLVRRRLLQEGRDELLDADRRVPDARLHGVKRLPTGTLNLT